MSHELGTNLTLWVGRVVDLDDPEKLGRVRVRMIGLHVEDETLIPTDTLPWAIVSSPGQSASINGVGSSPTGIDIGSSAWGFFLDGASMQQPLLCGTWWGKPKGISEVSGYVTGEKSIAKGDLNSEPANRAAPVYPHNKVHTTKAGHVLEIDDTPGAERIHIYHKSGTYVEMTQEGDHIVKVKGDGYDLTAGNKTVYVGGNVNIVVKGEANIKAETFTITEG